MTTEIKNKIVWCNVPSGGGATFPFYDSFTYSDGDLATVSGGMWVIPSGSDGCIVSSGTAAGAVKGNNYENIINAETGSIEQYGCFMLSQHSFTGDQYIGMYFRYIDDANDSYLVQISGSGSLYWIDVKAWSVIESGLITYDEGHKYGITVHGTGNNTEVRVWLDPTANTPISYDHWDVADSPTLLLTNNPAHPADTGKKIGIFIYEGDPAPNTNIDNVYAGVCP